MDLKIGAPVLTFAHWTPERVWALLEARYADALSKAVAGGPALDEATTNALALLAASSKPSSIKCPHCGESRGSKGGMEYHLKQSVCLKQRKRGRATEPATEEDAGSEVVRTCPACEKRFYSELGARGHIFRSSTGRCFPGPEKPPGPPKSTSRVAAATANVASPTSVPLGVDKRAAARAALQAIHDGSGGSRPKRARGEVPREHSSLPTEFETATLARVFFERERVVRGGYGPESLCGSGGSGGDVTARVVHLPWERQITLLEDALGEKRRGVPFVVDWPPPTAVADSTDGTLRADRFGPRPPAALRGARAHVGTGPIWALDVIAAGEGGTGVGGGVGSEGARARARAGTGTGTGAGAISDAPVARDFCDAWIALSTHHPRVPLHAVGSVSSGSNVFQIWRACARGDGPTMERAYVVAHDADTVHDFAWLPGSASAAQVGALAAAMGDGVVRVYALPHPRALAALEDLAGSGSSGGGGTGTASPPSCPVIGLVPAAVVALPAHPALCLRWLLPTRETAAEGDGTPEGDRTPTSFPPASAQLLVGSASGAILLFDFAAVGAGARGRFCLADRASAAELGFAPPAEGLRGPASAATLLRLIPTRTFFPSGGRFPLGLTSLAPTLSAVRSIAVSPAAAGVFASAHADGTLRVWNSAVLPPSAQHAALPLGPHELLSCDFSPSGASIIATSAGGSVFDVAVDGLFFASGDDEDLESAVMSSAAAATGAPVNPLSLTSTLTASAQCAWEARVVQLPPSVQGNVAPFVVALALADGVAAVRPWLSGSRSVARLRSSAMSASTTVPTSVIAEDADLGADGAGAVEQASGGAATDAAAYTIARPVRAKDTAVALHRIRLDVRTVGCERPLLVTAAGAADGSLYMAFYDVEADFGPAAWAVSSKKKQVKQRIKRESGPVCGPGKKKRAVAADEDGEDDDDGDDNNVDADEVGSDGDGGGAQSGSKATAKSVKRARKAQAQPPEDDPQAVLFHLDVDGKYSACAVCGDGGDICLCDACPNAFHIECLTKTMGVAEPPDEGTWHCPPCTGIDLPADSAFDLWFSIYSTQAQLDAARAEKRRKKRMLRAEASVASPEPLEPPVHAAPAASMPLPSHVKPSAPAPAPLPVVVNVPNEPDGPPARRRAAVAASHAIKEASAKEAPAAFPSVANTSDIDD